MSGGVTPELKRVGDRYAVDRLLGRGGFGTVYAALDERLSAPVAIKVLSRVGPGAVVRFKEEFRRAASLVHPGLVVLHELAFESQAPAPFWYFTMDLLEGDALSTLLAPTHERQATRSTSSLLDETEAASGYGAFRPHAALSPDRAVALLAEVATALGFLHQAGVVHCDLKPSNIIVRRASGQPVLVDFGLSTAIDDAQRVGGTPHYMAPEQVEGLGSNRALEPSADAYALGVLIFEALSGRLPFEGEPRAVMELKRRARAPRLSSVLDRCPPELDEVVAALLASDARQRPSVETARSALLGLHAGAASPVKSLRAVETRPLRGREAVVQTALEGLAHVDDRHALVVLSGPSGIGKSATAAEIARRFELRADESATGVVLRAACHERERGPFELIDGLASALWNLAGADAPREALTKLAVVAPSLLVRLAEPADVASEPHEQRRQAVRALAQLLAWFATRGRVTLWLEDLHDLDADSRAFLSELLHVADTPLRILATTRPGQGPGQALFDECEHSASCRVMRLPLAPLPKDAARELLRDEALAPAVVEHLVDSAEGNPFLLDQLAEQARVAKLEAGEPVPTLAAMVDGRLRRLGPAARALLELLAVSARPVATSFLMRAGAWLDRALVPAEHASALHALRGVRLLQQASAGADVVLRHPALAPAVLGALPVERVRGLHRVLAEVEEREASPDAELVARHFIAALEPRRAAVHLDRAASHALKALAFERALELDGLAREVSEPDHAARVAIALRRGAALSALGRGVESAAEFGAAAALVEEPSTSLELGRRSAEQLLRSGRIAEGLTALDAVLKRLGMHRPSTRFGALWLLLRSRLALRISGGLHEKHDAAALQVGVVGADAPTPLETAAGAGAAHDVAAALRADGAWTLAMTLGFVDPLLAAAYSAVHAREANRAGGGLRRLHALGSEAVSVSGRGAPGRAAALGLLERMERLSRRVGGARSVAHVAVARGVTCALLGDFGSSVEACQRASRLFETSVRDAPWDAATSEHFLMWGALERGRLELILERAPRLYEQARSRGDHYAACGLGAHYANLAWLVRDPVMARQVVSECAALWKREQFSLPLYDVAMAEVHLELWHGTVSEQTMERLEVLFTSLRRAFFFQVEAVRADAGFLRARASVALLTQARGTAERRQHRARAERHLAWLRGAKLDIAGPMADLLRGAVLHHEGDARSLDALTAAANGLERVGLMFLATLARRAVARASGDGATRDLLDAELRALGVGAPDRLAAIFTPGLA